MGDVFESKVSEEEYQNRLSDSEFALSSCGKKLQKARELLLVIKNCGSHFMIKKYIDKYFDEEKE